MNAEEPFRSYVRERTAALSRIAFLLTGDRHAAEDLVQETLLRVAGRWRRISAGGDPDAYVRRAMYHQHVSFWRRSRRRPLTTPEPPDRAAPDPTAGIAGRLTVHAPLARLRRPVDSGPLTTTATAPHRCGRRAGRAGRDPGR